MKWVAAPLAAALCAAAIAGCGGGAEPGAPQGATLILDFTPNAVHSGIYAAQHRGYFEDAGVDLTIREPSASSDAPKLLEAGRADFAVMDINDLGQARVQGYDIAGVADIVQMPLAAVIAGEPTHIHSPQDLAGKTVGVTGVPSDDAVLDSVLRTAGVDPASVHRTNIGFNAVAALSSGKVDAATAFWNAEGVQLHGLGVPTREFRVADEPGVRFPELILAASRDTFENRPELVSAMRKGLRRGYLVLTRDPEAALDDLIAEVPGTDRESQQAQLAALLAADAFSTSSGPGRGHASIHPTIQGLLDWMRWALGNRLFRDSDANALRQLYG